MSAEKLYKELTQEFKSDALSSDTSRGFELTSIKAQYVVERLNTVLGFNNWSASYTYLPQEDGSVVCLCNLTVTLGDTTVTREAVGGAQKKKQVADTYKSAMTDSLGKAASHIGVGNDVFKGLVAPTGATKTSAKKTTTAVPKKSSTGNWKTKSSSTTTKSKRL